MVEVPLATEGLVAVHQHVMLGSLPAIKVFHLEAFSRSLPFSELVVVAEELVVSNRLDAVAFEHGFAVPAHWLHGNHPLNIEVVAVGGEPRRQRRRRAFVDLEPVGTQFASEVAHCADHQVSALAVPAFGPELQIALDHEDPTVAWLHARKRTLTIQLVAEDPHRREFRRHYWADPWRHFRERRK